MISKIGKIIYQLYYLTFYLYVYLICLSIFSQIKMSSPNMNNLIITGCILSYTSVIVLGLDSHITSIEAFPYICTARAWMVMWGFTLSFGSMFSKTWRVHSIFTNVQLNKKVVRIIIPNAGLFNFLGCFGYSVNT